MDGKAHWHLTLMCEYRCGGPLLLRLAKVRITPVYWGLSLDQRTGCSSLWPSQCIHSGSTMIRSDYQSVWKPRYPFHQLSSNTREPDNVVGLESRGNLGQTAGLGPRYPQACSVVIGSKARSPPPLARGIFNTNRTSRCSASTAASHHKTRCPSVYGIHPWQRLNRLRRQLWRLSLCFFYL